MAQYANSEVLVETQWLADHLKDPNIRIVEVDMSPDPFEQAHIPGALFWNIFQDILSADLSMNLQPVAIEKLLSRSGITPETTVVAYGSYPGTGAWIFWLLKFFGHEKVYVLNGGYQKWVAENRPLAPELSNYEATAYKAKSPDTSLRVLQPEVLAALTKPNCAILDVRTEAEYKGEIFATEPPKENERGGHIPGAVHIEHTQAMHKDGTYKSVEALQKLYGNQGITADKTIFPYCAIGARSAGTWFVLTQLLGYPNVRNYDGSWNQWSRLPDVPIES
ncbi:MAG: sulfurtransferase [Cyanobacteria bacterium P01_F01_bin.3]